MRIPAAKASRGRQALYGFDLDSDLSFEHRLATAAGGPRLRISASRDPPGEGVEDSGALEPGAEPTLLFRSALKVEEGQRALVVHRLPEPPSADWHRLRFAQLADIYVGDRRLHVRGSAGLRAEHGAVLELRLLGPVMAFFLERCGMPVLHASAVAAPGGAVGFLATNRGGKTGLAASCLQQGAALLTDDLLALEIPPVGSDGAIRGRPSYPQMRVWPDLARYLVGEQAQDLLLVHPRLDKRRLPVAEGARPGFGRFALGSTPLKAIYVPERRPSKEGVDIVLEELSPRDALLELLRHSFVRGLVEACGWIEERLDQLGRLVEQVPVRRLRYPEGFERLDEVAAAVAENAGLELPEAG